MPIDYIATNRRLEHKCVCEYLTRTIRMLILIQNRLLPMCFASCLSSVHNMCVNRGQEREATLKRHFYQFNIRHHQHKRLHEHIAIKVKLNVFLTLPRLKDLRNIKKSKMCGMSFFHSSYLLFFLSLSLSLFHSTYSCGSPCWNGCIGCIRGVYAQV